VTANPWVDLLGLINGYQISQAISVASKLRIADHLCDGARNSEELAVLTQSNEGALYRLLRALAAVGVFREEANRTFSLTPMGDCLRADSATPIGAWAEYSGSPYIWRTWGHLLHSIQSGENAFHDLNGTDIWHYRADRPEERAVFDRAMTELSRGSVDAIINAYDFSTFQHVIDVGGGRGLMLAAILAAHPHMRGTLFDQSNVAAESAAVFKEQNVVERAHAVGGSFFDSVPEGGDAYVMRAVIHDWDDADAVTILKVCRRAIQNTGAKLLLIERIVAPPNEMPSIKFMDLQMLAILGARERTREEFEALLAKGGFELSRVAPAGTLNVIEALPN
jgi:hypothetical protein